MAALMKVTDASGTMLVRGDCRAYGRLGWINLTSFNLGRPLLSAAAALTGVSRTKWMCFGKGRDNASFWLSEKVSGQIGDDPIKLTIETSVKGATLTFVFVDVLLDFRSYAASIEEYEASFERMSKGSASAAYA